MWLCPYLCVLMLTDCSQLSIEPGAFKSGPLQKAWPDLAGSVKLPGISTLSVEVMLAPAISLLLLDWRHPLGPRVYDSSTGWDVSCPLKGKINRAAHFCCLFLETLELSFFFFLSLFGWLPECVHSSCPIILKVWYFWQFKSSTPPAWTYPQNVSKHRKPSFLMVWWGEKVGLAVLPGLLVL